MSYLCALPPQRTKTFAGDPGSRGSRDARGESPGLKPLHRANICGTAEAVPFKQSIKAADGFSCSGRLEQRGPAKCMADSSSQSALLRMTTFPFYGVPFSFAAGRDKLARMRLHRVVPILVLSSSLLSVAHAAAPPALTASAPAPAPLASAAERSKQLADLFAAMWEQNLKDNPEYASILGDKRYDDRLSDYSVESINAQLARGRQNIQKLSEIDTTGPERPGEALRLDDAVGPHPTYRRERASRSGRCRSRRSTASTRRLPQLVAQLSFDNEADYTHYIARLHEVPRVFSQNTTNMMLGMDEGRIPPAFLLEKMLVQVQTLADQKAEESPFAHAAQTLPCRHLAGEAEADHGGCAGRDQHAGAAELSALREVRSGAGTSPRGARTRACGRCRTATPTMRGG